MKHVGHSERQMKFRQKFGRGQVADGAAQLDLLVVYEEDCGRPLRADVMQQLPIVARNGMTLELYWH